MSARSAQLALPLPLSNDDVHAALPAQAADDRRAGNAALLSINRSPDLLRELSPWDREQFYRFGWGSSVEPRFPTISDAIAYQVKTQPRAVAATHLGKSLTYAQLDAAANRLAIHLYDNGVRRGDAVCLFLKRSLPMLVGIVATMRLGAAYVPQHVGVAPAEMLKHISATVNAKVILTMRELSENVSADTQQKIVCIEDFMSASRSTLLPGEREDAAHPDDVATILFTSGTTGVPNGVRVTHRNLCNVLQTSPGDLGMRPGVKVGQVLSIAFDMAAWETLGALSNGATLVIRDRSIQDTAEEVDILIATPSILASLDIERCGQIKSVAVAGEPCPRPLADAWSSFCHFYNSCGPTETTIVNTMEKHHPTKSVLSIGRPTPNNTVYILDDDLNPLPMGATGEMWAGGDCVTAGYLGNKPLTNERYRPDPFRPGHMMFQTRDLGRWTINGELEHFGRTDDVVKIRGFRVELQAVTSVLESAGCKQAITLKLNDRHLVSFATPASIDVNSALQSIATTLPYYYVPLMLLPLDVLPRTSRGKLDKRLLLEMAMKQLQANDARGSK